MSSGGLHMASSCHEALPRSYRGCTVSEPLCSTWPSLSPRLQTLWVGVWWNFWYRMRWAALHVLLCRGTILTEKGLLWESYPKCKPGKPISPVTPAVTKVISSTKVSCPFLLQLVEGLQGFWIKALSIPHLSLGALRAELPGSTLLGTVWGMDRIHWGHAPTFQAVGMRYITGCHGPCSHGACIPALWNKDINKENIS